MSELKLIRCGEEKVVYLHNNKYVSVDTFNNILDGWYYMGYDIKKYSMNKDNRQICVWYIK